MADTQLWHLVARKLSGEASMEELRELERLLQEDPELAYKIDVYTRYFEHPPAGTQRNAEAKKLSWQQTRKKLATEFPVEFADTAPEEVPVVSFFQRNKKWMAFAALLILVSLGIVWFNAGRADKQLAAAEPQWKEMNTMPGTRSKTILPDGTIVWLNSDSKVTYNAEFGKNKREISLEGEAFFDVAHNAEVPMLVKAKNVNIWVKGTAFNVKSYPESSHVETSLIRGSVELTTDNDPERKILLKPNEKITIEVDDESKKASGIVAKPGASSTRQGLYHIDKLQESVLANMIPEISWVQNKLVFDNERFTDIIVKMEKWYNVEIVVRNKQLESKSFSGVFEKENVAQALEALQLINRFEFEIKGSKVFIK